MKQRLTALIASVLALVVLTVGFLFLEQHCQAPVPVPSVPGGYYDEEFVLQFTAPENGTIYYTTDGSTPTTQSAVYSGGIPIVNRSNEPNIYKAVQNVVSDWKTYTPDPTPVEKGTVVRAIYVSDWGQVSDILTQTYFVGIPQPEEGYTLSIVFEYDDLFGENGIYVTGKEYDDWYLSDGDPAQAPLPNFMKDMEVVTTAEWLDSEGDILNQPVGLRIQGNTARIYPAKRLTLTAREEYSGSQFFDAPLFPDVITHSVMLKDSLPDAMMSDLLQDRSVSTQQCIPVRVYLNGEFLYSSYMFERYDSQYFRQYYQVADKKSALEQYLSDYHRALEAGEKIGIKVYLGAELRWEHLSDNDYLLLGVDEAMLSDVFDYMKGDAATFVRDCKSEKSFFLQAHPFRDGLTRLNPALLDGIEAFNLHPGHNSRIALASQFADAHHLIKTIGTDFHHEGHHNLCATRMKILPDDSFALAAELKKNDFIAEISGSLLLP